MFVKFYESGLEFIRGLGLDLGLGSESFRSNESDENLSTVPQEIRADSMSLRAH